MSAKTAEQSRANPDRITVGLTQRSSEDLTRLFEKTGMTKTDLVNRAIGLYSLMTTRVETGYQLGFIGPADEQGKPVIEIVHIL